jgi:type IV secretory pathway VirJ component
MASTAAYASDDRTVTYGSFGKVHLYGPESAPKQVVLFVSGDGGWNQGVVDMAKEIAALDILVAGIDIKTYLKNIDAGKGSCSYPAGDFESLSQYLQQSLGLTHYMPPILVGYSSGATLVYATLVEAPPNTFAGAMSMGFCPDLPLHKPLCKGNGLEWGPGPKGKGYSFLPTKGLQQPWIAFQGLSDRVCDPTAVETYVKEVSGATAVMLPKVGHGFSVYRNWLPQFKDAIAQLAAQKPVGVASDHPGATAPAAGGAVDDLPLVEVPAQAKAGDRFALILTGDGGWAGIDRSIGDYFASKGVPVVGLNSLQYFWKKRTPEGAARDVERIVGHYSAKWEMPNVILVGYSRGADVLPGIVARMEAQSRERVETVAMLAPARTAEFEFHVSDWISSSSDGMAIKPEVEKLRGTRVLCFYGTDEADSLCPTLEPALATKIAMPGGHHFEGAYGPIADAILKAGAK